MAIHKHTKSTLLAKLQKFTDANQRLPCTHSTKLQLINLGLLVNHCAICGLNEWQGKPISLHLDHIDGNATHNVLANLRVLCPNCHSQTSTYCGKNKKRYAQKKNYFCKDCDKPVASTKTIRCVECYYIYVKKTHARDKITWPDKIALTSLLNAQKSMEAVAQRLGVSSNAIRKRCRMLNIDYHEAMYGSVIENC